MWGKKPVGIVTVLREASQSCELTCILCNCHISARKKKNQTWTLFIDTETQSKKYPAWDDLLVSTNGDEKLWWDHKREAWWPCGVCVGGSVKCVWAAKWDRPEWSALWLVFVIRHADGIWWTLRFTQSYGWRHTCQTINWLVMLPFVQVAQVNKLAWLCIV